MKLSEHIANCQKMLEKFGDRDIEIPEEKPLTMWKAGIAIIHHYEYNGQSFYTLRRRIEE